MVLLLAGEGAEGDWEHPEASENAPCWVQLCHLMFQNTRKWRGRDFLPFALLKALGSSFPGDSGTRGSCRSAFNHNVPTNLNHWNSLYRIFGEVRSWGWNKISIGRPLVAAMTMLGFGHYSKGQSGCLILGTFFTCQWKNSSQNLVIRGMRRLQGETLTHYACNE